MKLYFMILRYKLNRFWTPQIKKVYICALSVWRVMPGSYCYINSIFIVSGNLLPRSLIYVISFYIDSVL